MNIKSVLVGVIGGALLPGTAAASLIDRGNGLLYDTVLNVTWLQDADLAATNHFGVVSGIDGLGRMDYSTAQSWIAGMNSAHWKGYVGWRLPSLGLPANDPDKSTSSNYELGYMLHVNLGVANGISSGGTYGLVQDLQANTYWYGVPFDSTHQWVIGMTTGYSSNGLSANHYYSWAVITGDVAGTTVPEPAPLALALAAMGGIWASRRRG